MWVDDQQHGNGKFTSPDGKTYIGNYEQNQRQGHGVFTHSNGTKYEGEWNLGAANG